MKETYAMQTFSVRCAMVKLLNELKTNIGSWEKWEVFFVFNLPERRKLAN